MRSKIRDSKAGVKQGGWGRAQVCWTRRRCRDWRGARRSSCGTSPSTIRCCWCGALVGPLLLLALWHPTMHSPNEPSMRHTRLRCRCTSTAAASPGLVQDRSYTHAREGRCCQLHVTRSQCTQNCYCALAGSQENLLDPDHGLYAHQVGCTAGPCAHLFVTKSNSWTIVAACAFWKVCLIGNALPCAPTRLLGASSTLSTGVQEFVPHLHRMGPTGAATMLAVK